MDSSRLSNMQINEKKLNLLGVRIYLVERDNFKTKKLKESDMSDKVRRIIESEVDKDAD